MISNDTGFYKEIGSRIRRLRAIKGMTHTELAEKAGLSFSVINGIENARSGMHLVTFANIAEALEVSPDDILLLKTPPSGSSHIEELLSLLEGRSPAELEAALRVIRKMFELTDSRRTGSDD